MGTSKNILSQTLELFVVQSHHTRTPLGGQITVQSTGVSDVGNKAQLSAVTARSVRKSENAVTVTRLFLHERAALSRCVHDQLAAAQDKQKYYTNESSRNSKEEFSVGDKVPLSVKNYPNDLVTMLSSGSKLLLPRFVGPFTVVKRIGALNYKLDLPTKLRTHPVFCVDLFKRYHEFTEDVHPSQAERGYPRYEPHGTRACYALTTGLSPV